MPGLSFLSKKKWHTSNVKNVEKVWVAEQKADEEQKRLAEFQKQLLEERQIQELRQLQAAQGHVVKHTDNSLDWMYEGPGGGSQVQKDSEEYLLGKIYKPQASSNTFEVGTANIEQRNNSSSAWVSKVSNKNDIFSRKHEDPMIAIKQAEKAQRDRIVNNPIQMEKIRQNVAKHLEEMDYARDRERRAKNELLKRAENVDIKEDDSVDSRSDDSKYRRKKKDKKKRKHHKKERKHRYSDESDVDDKSRDGDIAVEEKTRKGRRNENESRNSSTDEGNRRSNERKRGTRDQSSSRSTSPDGKRRRSKSPFASHTSNTLESKMIDSSKEHRRSKRSSSESASRNDNDKSYPNKRSRNRDDDSRDYDRGRREYGNEHRKRHSRSPDRRRSYRDSRDRDRNMRRRDDSRESRGPRRRDYAGDNTKISAKESLDEFGRHREQRRDHSRSRDHVKTADSSTSAPKSSNCKEDISGNISERKSWGLVFNGRQNQEGNGNELGPSKDLLKKKELERKQEEIDRQENLRRARGNNSRHNTVSEEERLARLRAMTNDAEMVDSSRVHRTQAEKLVQDQRGDNDLQARAGKSAEFITNIRSEVLKSAGESVSIQERLSTHRHYVQKGAALDDANTSSFLSR